MRSSVEMPSAPVVEWPPTERRAADVLVDLLWSAGVEVLFSVPGAAISPVHDALIDRPQIRLVNTRHESGAMYAAAGLARASGKLGVAAVTSGPGFFNATNGLASAHCDGLPVLLLVGEVPRKLYGKGSLQDGSPYHLNVVAMAGKICKSAVEVREPANLPALLKKAMALALSGRPGPVVLTLPLDVATAPIVVPRVALDERVVQRIPAEAIALLRTLLRPDRRVAILAGSGTRFGGGPAALLRLAERLQCPVATTPKAKGVFPEDHPLSIGVFGLGGHPSAYDYFGDGADVLLAIGTGLGDISTDGWSDLLRPRQALVQVDVDPAQLGRSYPVTLGVVASAEAFIASLLKKLEQHPRRVFGLRRLAELKVAEGRDGRITPQRALQEIQACLPSDTIFACDSGEHFVFATHCLSTTHPDAFIAMTGLGSMGSSIGAAIGAQITHPRRRVAALCGDGCFAMNGFEIATAASEKLPLCVFVMNDQRLGMVENGHASVYGRRPLYPTGPLDVVAVATGLGARAFRVSKPGEITALRNVLRTARMPVVIDVQIDRESMLPRRERVQVSGKRLPN